MATEGRQMGTYWGRAGRGLEAGKGAGQDMQATALQLFCVVLGQECGHFDGG